MKRWHRRSFLRAALGATLCCSQKPTSRIAKHNPYGELIEESNGIFRIPPGFSCRVLSQTDDLMNDGYRVPSACDGMAAISLADGRIALIRNHELDVNDRRPTAYGKKLPNRIDLPAAISYDRGQQGVYAMGGTTTLIVDAATGQVVDQRLSLAGTLRNCAGGVTPWSTWISCEETIVPAGGPLKRHGYCFEVDPILGGNPLPIKQMGFFRHEAVAFSQDGRIAYLTEDRQDSALYRFLVNEPGNLHAGGRLQALAVVGKPKLNTANHSGNAVLPRSRLMVEWLDIENPDPDDDRLRAHCQSLGAAQFCRGEGVVCDGRLVAFTCTAGGPKHMGQIWLYHPSPFEGRDQEKLQPGQLELFVESQDRRIMAMCDNLCFAPNGDLIVAEDGPGPSQRLLVVKPDGETYVLLEHFVNISELAGCTWSPDGTTLFFNVFHPGMTVALSGPWAHVN